MNLRRLSYFLAIVDHGTVTAAARSLLIAQPALSRQVRLLERELGLQLFQIKRNRLVLTPGGEKFVPVVRRLLQEAQLTEKIAGKLASGRLEKVVVAATPVTIQGILATVVSELRDDSPIVVTRSCGHYEIYEQLETGADMVISPLTPRKDHINRDLYTAHISALVHPDHPIAQEREGILLSQLEGLTLAIPSPKSVSRSELDSAMTAGQLVYGRYFECDDDVTLRAIAISGKAIAITTSRGDPDLVSLPLLVDGEGLRPLTLRMHAAWHPYHFATDVLDTIADEIADRYVAMRAEPA